MTAVPYPPVLIPYIGKIEQLEAELDEYRSMKADYERRRSRPGPRK